MAADPAPEFAPDFIPGLRLAREFYAAVVRPLLDERFPGVPHAAALTGPGSEVAGFDSQRSTDHDWGPRLQVFIPDSDTAPRDPTARDRAAGDTVPGDQAPAIAGMLARQLPESFRGYPVRFPLTGEPPGQARHHVRVTGLRAWADRCLGFDPREDITLLDWLGTPAQRLAEFTGGAVFHDDLGDLTRARSRLAWYPRDVWLYLLACQWQRIEQEEPFPGRCAEAGDTLGSAVVTARLARDMMRLCLLMHRRYPPYSKWLGTAFARLPGTGRLAANLTGAITAVGWPDRQRHLAEASEAVAARHNQLKLTRSLDTRTRAFWDRPYQVIGAARFAAALRETITDPVIARLPLAGAVDQFTDSTDASGDLRLMRACAAAVIGRTTGGDTGTAR